MDVWLFYAIFRFLGLFCILLMTCLSNVCASVRNKEKKCVALFATKYATCVAADQKCVALFRHFFVVFSHCSKPGRPPHTRNATDPNLDSDSCRILVIPQGFGSAESKSLGSGITESARMSSVCNKLANLQSATTIFRQTTRG